LPMLTASIALKCGGRVVRENRDADAARE
jgi:hypothetical protein